MNLQWNDSISHGSITQHIYCDYQKVEAKTVVKHVQQNKEINIKIFNDQFINGDKWLTHKKWHFSQRVHTLFIYSSFKKFDFMTINRYNTV